MTAQSETVHVEVEAEDLEDLEILYADLSGATEITASLVAAPMERGDLGGLANILTVALTSGAVTTFLQILRMLAESRGPHFRLRIRKGRDKVEITARDPQKGLEALKDLLDGQ